MPKKKIDLALLLIWPIAGSLLSFALKTNAFYSVIIFFGIPSLYLSLREKRHVKKAALFSLFGIPVIIFVDYIAHVAQAWLIPISVLPFRLFGFVTLEVILWVFLHIYFVIMFYEHFLDKHVTDKLWHPQMKYFLAIVFVLFLAFLGLLFVNPSLLKIPYWYLVVGIFLVLLPVVLEWWGYPRVFLKLLKAAVYFLYITLVYEITALKLGWWSFPGKEFIGWVSFFGVEFPFEEFFFWLVLTALAILSYYEFYDDDEK